MQDVHWNILNTLLLKGAPYDVNCEQTENVTEFLTQFLKKYFFISPQYIFLELLDNTNNIPLLKRGNDSFIRCSFSSQVGI